MIEIINRLNDFKVGMALRRDFDNKHTQLEKVYWHCAFIYLSHCQEESKVPDADLLASSFSSTFFQFEKLYYSIKDTFTGITRTKIKDEINTIASVRREWISEYYKTTVEIVDHALSFFRESQPNYNYLKPELAEFMDLTFVDSRHPHLKKVSQSLKNLLDDANHQYVENKLLHDRQERKIPRHVLKKLNESAEKLVLTYLKINALYDLEDYLLLGLEVYKPYLEVKGPTQAINQLMGTDSELINEQIARQKYLTCLRYRSRSGEPFEEDSVDKALRRYLNE